MRSLLLMLIVSVFNRSTDHIISFFFFLYTAFFLRVSELTLNSSVWAASFAKWSSLSLAAIRTWAGIQAALTLTSFASVSLTLFLISLTGSGWALSVALAVTVFVSQWKWQYLACCYGTCKTQKNNNKFCQHWSCTVLNRHRFLYVVYRFSLVSLLYLLCHFRDLRIGYIALDYTLLLVSPMKQASC